MFPFAVVLYIVCSVSDKPFVSLFIFPKDVGDGFCCSVYVFMNLCDDMLQNMAVVTFRHLLIASEARELISGPNLPTGARLLSSNWTQARVVIGLLTGHNTLRRHLYVMGLSDNPTCRKCGTADETSVHILCECEALASLRHTHLGSFFFLNLHRAFSI